MTRTVNQGITEWIDPMGEQRGYLARSTEGSVVARIRTSELSSVYVVYGDVVAWLCVLASGGLLVLGVLRKGPWTGELQVRDQTGSAG